MDFLFAHYAPVFELSILDFIQLHLRNGFFDRIMPFITRLGDLGAVWVLLCVLLLCLPKTRRYGYAILLALVLHLLFCNFLLKPLFARVRPFDVNSAVQLLIAKPTDFSFPSGHTSASFASASALGFSHCPGRCFAFGLAGIIAFSRLYLYVHYPTDVLAGMLLGIFCGWLAVQLRDRILPLLRSKQ